MSANIYQRDGITQLAWCIHDQEPWWVGGELGQGLPVESLNFDYARNLLGNIKLEQGGYRDVYGEWHEADHKVTVRKFGLQLTETGVVPEASEALGPVGGRYSPLSTEDFLAMGFGSDLRPSTVGLLAGARRAIITYELPQVDVGGGDIIRRWLNVLDSADGTRPTYAIPHNVRTVCCNTEAIVLQDKAKSIGKPIRHTGDTTAKSRELADAIAEATQFGDRIAYEAHQMQTVSAPSAFNALFDIVAPISGDLTQRTMSRRGNMQDEIRAVYSNTNNAGGGYGSNGWTVYNAYTEYMDHHRTVRGGDQLDRIGAVMDPWSPVHDQKRDVAEAILELAAV